jgi:hypothetical protein
MTNISTIFGGGLQLGGYSSFTNLEPGTYGQQSNINTSMGKFRGQSVLQPPTSITLSSLSATGGTLIWSTPTVSSLIGYIYSIGTTAGGTNITNSSTFNSAPPLTFLATLTGGTNYYAVMKSKNSGSGISNYSAASAAASFSTGTSSTFIASGTYSFTVPIGISSINVQLWGGYTTQTGAGYGGYVSGTLAVTPGETLGILVNIGGSGGENTQEGGGRAAIQRSSVDVVTAGGGGGQGFPPTIGGGVGGAGGGTTGQAGGNSTNCTGGGGGTQSAPGAGGTYSSPSGNNGNAGSGYVGGLGGAGNASNKNAGGGGGGYYGGGGGAFNIYDETGGGGGGGSSYVSTLIGTVVNSQGGNSTINGGQIILTWPGTLTYTLSYNASRSYDFGSRPNGYSGTVNVYSQVSQVFEVLLNGASQSPAVYLTVSDSSSRTLTLSGSGGAQYSVLSNTVVALSIISPIAGTYSTTATVGGTMTDPDSRTFSYSYEVAITVYDEGGGLPP